MFTHHCTACDKRQLIFMSQVSGVVPTAAGVSFAFTCWCGADQSWTPADAVGRAGAEPVAA